MTRTPYSRQLWQILGEAAAALLGFTVFGAGAARLIADSSVGDAATLVGVLSTWFGVTAVATGFLWQSGREACLVLRRRQARHGRTVQRTPRWYHEDELPPLDPEVVAQDTRIVEEAAAEEPASVETPQQAPTLGYTALMDPLDSGTWGFTGDPGSPAGPLPYAVRTDFDPAGARTVVAERSAMAAP